MMLVPSVAAIPNLVFAADLGPLDVPTGADDSDLQDHPTLLPTQCVIDLITSELRLQTLAPVGAVRRIRLEKIDSITRPESPRAVVDVEIKEDEPDAQWAALPPIQRLRLRAVDEHCASSLIAAISMPHRVMPG